MAQKISQGSIFGRIGSGLGQGLAEQIPKEVERYRLSEGLKKLGDKKGQTPFQQFSDLVSVAHQYPQVVQSGSDLLRQQSIIDSFRNQEGGNQPERPPSNIPPQSPLSAPLQEGDRSITTTGPIRATIEPYIPPTGEERERMARALLAKEPLVYQTIEDARNAVDRDVAANTNKSESEIRQRGLQQDVQNKTVQAVNNAISTSGANLPQNVIPTLQQKAINEVKTGQLTEDEAARKYGEEAQKLSRHFADVKALGGTSIITRPSKGTLQSMRNLSKVFKDENLSREFADAMVAENGVTPQFAYAIANPVQEIKPLNDILKGIPNIKPHLTQTFSAPGSRSGMVARPPPSGIQGPVLKQPEIDKKTNEIIPDLARAMGKGGSPLSVSYELDKKGYNSRLWKEYLMENQKALDLTIGQIEELSKPEPGMFGWLNDWWLQSFSGVK